ncbi:MAG: beta-N-acetylhexosaminidase, partial [Lachnospiraceae bacterium]|nr:beta-N-acetylhexosaminidase [Lachnospiraceae bacterium]
MISEELRKKVGQMMMCGFPSTVLDDQVRKLVDDFYVGNFIYFSRNCDTAGQTASLSADISHLVYDKLGIAPLISIDQEGGGVSRLVEGAALMSGASAVSGAVTELTPENVERVRQLGRICGRVLRSCG